MDNYDVDTISFDEEKFSLLNEESISDCEQSSGCEKDTRSNLNFDLDTESEEEKEKRKLIEAALDNDKTSLKKWQDLAKSKHGLVNDALRRQIWPLLLEVDTMDEKIPSLHDLSVHNEYNQVVLDVNRSLKRFPPGIPYNQRVALQDQLTVLILRVIMKYPHLRYYQGYHDVAVTFLLVVGEVMAFRIMERLSTNYLQECMEPTMEKTSYRLNYIYALLRKIDKTLHDFMDSASVGTMFALPWYLTWFGHSLNKYKDVVRLYDFFLATPPLMPLYVATSLVVERRNEILIQPCDMASIHCLLSQVPDDLDFESILQRATKFYSKYPPNKLESDVKKRVNKELQALNRGVASRSTIMQKIRNRWPNWLIFGRSRGFMFATAIVLIGCYIYYLKSNRQKYNFFGSILNSS